MSSSQQRAPRKREVQKNGSSFMVTIPKELARKYDLDPGSTAGFWDDGDHIRLNSTD